MENPNFIEDFYLKFEEVCKNIDSSEEKFIISSLGKQSLGKSYFLNKVFDCKIPTKVNQMVSKGTDGLYYSKLPDYHLLDLEGLESNESKSIRDAFNFYSVMVLSNIVLLHISHQDLENRKFIENFSYLLYQCLSPTKSNIYSFRTELPEIILLIKDPRWDNENRETIDAYEKLVSKFCNDVTLEVLAKSNELIDEFEKEEIKNFKKEDQRLKIREEYEKIRSVLKFEFKVLKYFIVYYQMQGFGNNKKIEYYELIEEGNNFYFCKSAFDGLKKGIIDLKIESFNNKSMNFIRVQNNRKISSINEFYQLLDLLEIQKKAEQRMVQVIKYIYFEVKFDIFFHMENKDEVIKFIAMFYKIKNSLDKLVESSYSKLERNKIGNQFREFFKYDAFDPSLDIHSNTKFEFEKIIVKNELNPYLNICFRYFQAVIAKRFNNIFNLNHKKKDSILYTTLLLF